ncbi:MAG: hypothetical protein JSR67_07730 [Proteobacteria bacterium]|nr:hypothetical protein [Pseudomonadota bacterium]
MQQIGVVGLSYRHAGVDDVARFAVPRADIPARLAMLREGLDAAEVLYLGTCNRVEVVFALKDGEAAGDARAAVFRGLAGRDPGPAEAARVLRAWTGEAALEHLMLLACGLDSAQAGEQEIATQLRGAWEEARAARTSGPLLDRVVGEALAMSRRVRRLSAGVQTPSLADLAADRVLQHLKQHRGRVGLLGVSPMTRRCALKLQEAGVSLVIVNRTLARAQELAAQVGGEALPLAALRERPPALAALVMAAGTDAAILDATDLARLAAAGPGTADLPAGAQAGNGATAPAAGPLLIDFGVPPNVDAAAARAARLTRLGMDALIDAAQGRRVDELVRLAPVRAAIDERLAHLRTELAARALGPRLAELRASFEQIAGVEAARALAHELRTLDPQQRAGVERLASLLAHRLAHLPLSGLRAAAVHASSDAVEAFFGALDAGRAHHDTEKS